MEQSFKCNPKIGFRGNIEAAMATVLLRHEDLREYDVQKILNAVRDDLKRMVKNILCGSIALILLNGRFMKLSWLCADGIGGRTGLLLIAMEISQKQFSPQACCIGI